MTPEAPPDFGLSALSLLVILFGSILVLALAIEQFVTFFKLRSRAEQLSQDAGRLLLAGNQRAVRSLCERSKSPLADVFLAALDVTSQGRGSPRRAAERAVQRLMLQLRRRLWMLGSMGALAPFVGLFGTVIGIIRAFRDIAEAGSGGFSVVAKGVSEALVATAGGIFVAVLAVAFYNVFQAKGGQLRTEIKVWVDEYLEQLELCDPEPASPISTESASPKPSEAP